MSESNLLLALFKFIYFNEAIGLAQMYREQAHLLSQDGFLHTPE